MLDDTIAAISTPPGKGGIAIIRISGENAVQTADKLFKGKHRLQSAKSHTIHYGKIVDPQKNETIDEVLVSVLRAPSSYTKEDTVEINCHGGLISSKKILGLILSLGIRMAEGGEFTKRAFLNGRIDLSQAEAVIDIVNSMTELSLKSAVSQMEGALSKEVKMLRADMLEIIATIEAAIDYPEHDIEDLTRETILNYAENFVKTINQLIEKAHHGKILREGVKAVILGKPNVGKSSLLNTLLNEERAIVTDIPGTTRDVLVEYINIGGIPLKLIDTAGIRNTDNTIEALGVKKTKEYAKKSDLVLFVIDGSRDIDDDDLEILDYTSDNKKIVIINKMDKLCSNSIDALLSHVSKNCIVYISAKYNQGIDLLCKKIKDMFVNDEISMDEHFIISNERHIAALKNSLNSCAAAIYALKSDVPNDLISIDLYDAYKYLGEITGESVESDLIDKIFSKFCLGK